MMDHRSFHTDERPRRAFTLIELLIVVAIISILASIAVPNFLEAQTRSKVARVKADIHSLIVAVESYRVDYQNYPYRRNTKSTATLLPDVPEADNRLQQMSVFTTPVAYITSLPADIFEMNMQAPNNVIDYWDPYQATWLINSTQLFAKPVLLDSAIGYMFVSVGPDGYLGPGETGYGWPSVFALIGADRIAYDPTNGAISTGNIYVAQGPGMDGTPGFITKRMSIH